MIDPTESRCHFGDAADLLRQLPDKCVQTCVTSPPYWGLRDYGVDGQIGLESSPDAYVARIVEVFREVRRALKDDGTLWLNLGDSYAATTKGSSGKGERQGRNRGTHLADRHWSIPTGLKPKDLVGIPWMVAFALRADGWYLRSDIIWHKPNPMPESVRDRPTKAHEYLFLLSKSERYKYNVEAVSEAASNRPDSTFMRPGVKSFETQAGGKLTSGLGEAGLTRNRRSVWTVTPKPFKGAHFATMPPGLVGPCILAGSGPGDVVLDPFFGSGTTGMVAEQHGRKWIGFDLNPAYEAVQRQRLAR